MHEQVAERREAEGAHQAEIETPMESGQGTVSRRGAEAQRMRENAIGTVVIEAAIAVHRELGPGLLETVYEVILARELHDRGLKVDRLVPVAITYKGIRGMTPLRLRASAGERDEVQTARRTSWRS